jgi:hypothetical protein
MRRNPMGEPGPKFLSSRKEPGSKLSKHFALFNLNKEEAISKIPSPMGEGQR